MPKQIKDLSGEIFGVLQVLERDQQRSQSSGRVYWTCKCLKCNNEYSVRSDGLKNLPKSCPNCKNPNLKGKQYGQLTVIKKSHVDKNGHSYWKCQCSCGNIKDIAGSNLIQGHTKSCGCLHSEIISNLLTKDLTGQRFGQLTVLSRSSVIGERIKWLCKCSCGNTVEVQSNNLINGHTQSCGCLKSIGEQKIREVLLNNQILFKTEYSFLDLPQRRFDFAIFNEDGSIKYLIEFDGKQHYKYISTWHQTEEDYQKAKQRDEEKNQYCKNNNYILIRIPYWNIDKISIEYLNKKYMEEAQDGVDE